VPFARTTVVAPPSLATPLYVKPLDAPAEPPLPTDIVRSSPAVTVKYTPAAYAPPPPPPPAVGTVTVPVVDDALVVANFVVSKKSEKEIGLPELSMALQIPSTAPEKTKDTTEKY